MSRLASWFAWATPLDWAAIALCVVLACYAAWTAFRLDALRWPDLDEKGDEEADAPLVPRPWDR